MIKKPEVVSENAILIGVIRSGTNENIIHEYLDELELLADTAGVNVVGRVTQHVSKINAATFIGRGKAKQVINQAVELKVNLILFDDELSPAQIKNYHQMSKGIKILDRSGLILDIFRKRARTKEAKTQVNLAYLEYLLPRLTRQWTHLERQMGGIGTRSGMGETQIEVDRRLIRTRITKLKKELSCIEKERSTQGAGRKNEYRVSLVGYTNAGKSTLFNALSGADVYIQDQLFATLDTTIRKVNLDRSHSILLSDTVGFIRKLPHNLVASFKSTLKEVLESELIIKVFDISSPQIFDHIKTINNVLDQLGASGIQDIIVLNKVDLISDFKLIKKRQRDFPDAIPLSALEHLRLSRLTDRILVAMKKNYKTIDLMLSYDQGRLINQAQDGVEVLNREYFPEGIKLKIRGNQVIINKILRLSSTEK